MSGNIYIFVVSLPAAAAIGIAAGLVAYLLFRGFRE